MKIKATFSLAFFTYNILFSHYSLEILTESSTNKIINFIVEQQLSVFSEYPYLYQGNREEETKYVEWLITLPSSSVVVAYYNDQPIGFLTGVSFLDYKERFKDSVIKFTQAGLNPANFYYISEVIVVPEHRLKKISSKLFELAESFAKAQGYSQVCLVSESHHKHPLKPQNYRSIDTLWEKLKYKPAYINLTFNWPTRQVDGTIKNQEHVMEYWIKEL